MSKSYRRRNRIGGQFAPRLIEMLESPAYRVLSRAAHQVLARIEIELAHHGGMDNGKLPVTYAQLVEYGLHHNAIAPAIRELAQLGFIEITEQGRAGNADFRTPSKYRITYRHADRANPTDEWRRITEDEAAMIAKGARRPSSNSAHHHPPSEIKKVTRNRKPHPKSVLRPAPEKRTENGNSPHPENGCTGHSTETGCTIDTLGVVVGDAAVGFVEEKGRAPAPQRPDPWADLDIPMNLRRHTPHPTGDVNG